MFGNAAQPSRIFGFPAHEPISGLAVVLDQLRLSHRYRNALIGLERDRRTRVDDAVRLHVPVIAETEARILLLDRAIGDAEAAIKRRNAQARRRTATNDDRASLSRLKADRKDAYAARKIARTVAFGDSILRKRLEADGIPRDDPARSSEWRAALGHAALRADLGAIDVEVNAAQKALRAASGLYWGSYLKIEQSLGGIRSGAPPEFRGWAAEGHSSLAVQIQASKPLDVPGLVVGNDSRLRLKILPPGPRADLDSKRSRDDRRAVVFFRVGTAEDVRSPVWAEIPFRLRSAQSLPEDGQIKWAYLHRRIVGGVEYPEDFDERLAEAREGRKTRARYSIEWQIQFVVAKDEWEKPGQAVAGVAGLDVNWRLVERGLRVAYLIGDDGHERELVIPAEELTLWSKADDLRSIRDKEFDAARDLLAGWLGRDGVSLPQWFRERVEYLPRWKSPNRMAALVWRWRESRFPGDDSIYPALEAWRKQDRHLCDWEAAQRTMATERRDYLYRHFAHEIAGRYATIRIEDTNWAKLQERPKADATPEESAAYQVIRVNRRIAAVGRLLQFVREAARQAEAVSAKKTTERCHQCGYDGTWGNEGEMIHTCDGCGAVWDRDRNAAINLRDHAAGEEAGVGVA